MSLKKSYLKNLSKISKKLKKNQSNLKKLISKLNRKQKIAGVASIGLCLFAVGLLAFFPVVKTAPEKQISFPTIIKATKTSANLNGYDNVERYEVPGATKTVIYVPQIHREPTSNAQDSTNDAAYGIQKEIYKTLDQLVNNNHITFVMDESDLYGPMPADKIKKVQEGFNNINEFQASLIQTVDQYLKDGGSPKVADQIKKAGQDRIDKYERNIYLTGGAAVLAAKNEKANVYGSQNAATLTEAKNELQNLVYMENRINQLQQGSTMMQRGAAVMAQNAGTGQMQQYIQQILSMMSAGGSDFGASLNPVYALAQQKSDNALKAVTDDLNQKASKLQITANFETNSGPTVAPPTVANNYQNRTDLNGLKAEFNQNYEKFAKLAKDQRSQEVADNMVKGMDENNQHIGILVFGVQHKDQLIKAFNDKGISVIVITPNSEKTYLDSQPKNTTDPNKYNVNSNQPTASSAVPSVPGSSYPPVKS